MKSFFQFKAKKQIIRFTVIFILLGITANYAYRYSYNVSSEKILMRTDSEGYYQYLPHFFIMDWDRMDKMHWAKQYAANKTLNVYTCGVAIMQLPFFLAAHLFSHFFELETDGYTSVYFNSVFFASLFYVLIGLLFIYKFLLRFFSHRTALYTIILLFFGTNLFYYTNITPGMSHAYSFSLIAVFIYFVSVFYDKPTFGNLIGIAIPMALATLIRPTNLLISIFLFLYGITNWSEVKERFLFWIKRWYYILILLFVGILFFIPQSLYWHAVTGKYIYYSYMDEGFTNFRSPKILTVLIGPRNGWFIYTPLMIFASVSLIYLTLKKKFSSFAISLIMILIIYINSSWWRPTFSAAVGYRALIEYIPFMAIPFAWFFEKTYTKNNKIIQITLTTVFVLFVVYNILFAYKYNSGVWWNEEWTWSNFLRLVKF